MRTKRMKMRRMEERAAQCEEACSRWSGTMAGWQLSLQRLVQAAMDLLEQKKMPHQHRVRFHAAT